MRVIDRIFLVHPRLEGTRVCVVTLLVAVILQSQEGIDIPRTGGLRRDLLEDSVVVESRAATGPISRQIADGG